MKLPIIAKYITLFTILCLSTPSYAIMQHELSDTSITSSIISKLSADQSLSGTNIGVITTKGVVSLSGQVDSTTQASAAIEIAQSVPSVKDVDTNNLNVKGSEQPITDTAITAKIKGMYLQTELFGNKDINIMTINVETNNGIVSLSGTAKNITEENNAVKIAKDTNGVKDVINSITISSSNQ